MSVAPLRISCVSYVNARPFVYGIQHSGALKDFNLSLDVPSVCAEKLISGEADLGLAPVAVIPLLKEPHLLPGFCIGANGPVRTVMLYSDVPLRNIRSVQLDNESRTSAMLVKILARERWKISPSWVQAKDGYEKKIAGTVAGLVIGDRNFSLEKKFSHAWDLSEEWKSFTGLPFVFACWISNKKLDPAILDAFSTALKFGLDNRDKVLKELSEVAPVNILREYLHNNIQYNFDDSKRKALDLFLKLGKEIA